MHIVALAVLALLLGFIHQLIFPKLQSAVPASLQQGRILGAFFTGAFILVAFFLANMVLGVTGLRKA
jgi:hypothetical protein